MVTTRTPEKQHYIVIGGGCYGKVHTEALLRGRRKGYVTFDTITVVDRHASTCLVRRSIGDEPALQFVEADWFDYMKAELDSMGEGDEIVPAPIAPHLAFEWVMWSVAQQLPQASISIEPFDYKLGLPYEVQGKEGTGFLSWADFVCVPNCRAPKICPAILKPRFWEMSETVLGFAAAQAEGGQPFAATEIFKCHFCAPGVEAIPVSRYQQARDSIAAAARTQAETRALIATVSACHGAVNLIRISSRIYAESR